MPHGRTFFINQRHVIERTGWSTEEEGETARHTALRRRFSELVLGQDEALSKTVNTECQWLAVPPVSRSLTLQRDELQASRDLENPDDGLPAFENILKNVLERVILEN